MPIERHHRLASYACALLVLACAAPLRAAPIVVTNASFEDPALQAGESNAVVPGWVISGAWGVYHPQAGVFNTIPDGAQTTYANLGTLSQTLAPTLAADTQYTLTVHVGRRLDFAGLFPGYTVALYADDDLLAAETFDAQNPNANPAAPLPDPGDFVPVSVTYLSAAADPRHLRIVLSSLAIQTNFDAVSLDASPAAAVPEPAAALLVGPALAGLAAFARRRRGVASAG